MSRLAPKGPTDEERAEMKRLDIEAAVRGEIADMKLEYPPLSEAAWADRLQWIVDAFRSKTDPDLGKRVAKSYFAVYPRTDADFERMARRRIEDNQYLRKQMAAKKVIPNKGKGLSPKDPKAGVTNSTGGQVSGTRVGGKKK